MEKDSYILKTLSKAIDVINIFENEAEALTITEISKRTTINRTTLYRILYTLRSRGYIEMDVETGKYSLGLKLVQLSSLVLQRSGIKQVARPFLEQLRDDLNETVHLVIHNEGKAIFIDKIEVSRTIFMGSFIGWIAPLYCTASGKLLLSYQSKEYIDHYLSTHSFKAYTQNTLTDKDKLREELNHINREGISVDNEEIVEGLTCFAAPIVDKQGNILASVSVSGPTSRMVANNEDIVSTLIQNAKSISDKLATIPATMQQWV